MFFQHFRYLAPPSPNMYASCLPSHGQMLIVPLFARLFVAFSTKNHNKLFALLECSAPFHPFKNTFKNQWLFNIFTSWSHQAHTYMHHTAISCLDANLSSFWSFLVAFFSLHSADGYIVPTSLGQLSAPFLNLN